MSKTTYTIELQQHNTNIIMPAPLEKQPSPYIHNGEKVESQATPEVKADIAVIAAFEQ